MVLFGAIVVGCQRFVKLRCDGVEMGCESEYVQNLRDGIERQIERQDGVFLQAMNLVFFACP